MELELPDFKPSIYTALIILLVVVLTVPLAKAAMTKWPVPGLSDLVMAI